MLAGYAIAQSAHDENHGHQVKAAQHLPTEPGQGAFASIAEIAALLAADPGTDWKRVDIDALQAHLVDMDRLVTLARPANEDLQDGLRITLPLDGPEGATLLRMLPAHGPVLEAETGWTSDLEITETWIVWTVTSPTEALRIQGLGFFGLMATGDHHRAHHLALATGEMAH
ncbi:MAG: hypothetical protein HKN63_10335 [Rhodobacteraceae bacterium]|nr:hypothetical protein [Paracoccaceae bacterium]